jgi:hypothetical protein
MSGPTDLRDALEVGIIDGHDPLFIVAGAWSCSCGARTVAASDAAPSSRLRLAFCRNCQQAALVHIIERAP